MSDPFKNGSDLYVKTLLLLLQTNFQTRVVFQIKYVQFIFLDLDYQTEGKTTGESQEANSSLLCLQVELYTKGNGLYAATHHFFACK